MRRLSLVLTALVFGPGCVTFSEPPGVRITSDPPGATIYVDGVDSGFLTPAFIDLDGDDARIDLELAGYETATRIVVSDTQADVIHWNEMSIGVQTWRHPLWLDYDDFLGFPIGGPLGYFVHSTFKTVYRPTRIFVRMRLSGES